MNIRSVTISLLLILGATACSSGSQAAGPSAVHDWASGQIKPWLRETYPDAGWTVSVGGGGGGGGGSEFHYLYDHHMQATLPKSERATLMADLRAGIDRQITSAGGEINGRGTSGDPVSGFSFEYRADGATGGIVVESVDGEDGQLHIIMMAYEVR